MKNKEFIKKVIKNGLIFIIFVAITFYIVFKDNNIDEILKIVSTIKIRYILIAIVCMFCFIFLEGINIRRTLKLLGNKITLLQAFKYGAVGFFFSSVTPSATGGDPMQLYYMQKDGLPVSHSTLALLIELSSFQFTTISIAIIGFLLNYKFMTESIGNIKYFLLFGLVINIGILVVLLLAIFSKKIITKLVNLIYNILKFFKYKKVEEFKIKSNEQIEEYRNGAKFIKNNKKVLIKIVLTTTVQIMLYHSIPFLVYKSFGLQGFSIATFIGIQAVLFVSVSALPFPGAVGVSEGSFMIIYKLLFPESILSSAMLLSRGVSFYMMVLITGTMLLILTIYKRNKIIIKEEEKHI